MTPMSLFCMKLFWKFIIFFLENIFEYVIKKFGHFVQALMCWFWVNVNDLYNININNFFEMRKMFDWNWIAK